MKLLLCKNCYDIVKLMDAEPRHCRCGKVGGRLTDGEYYAEYWGAEAVPIGLANSSLAEAVRRQPKEGMGATFTAFVIPKKCATMTKVRKPRGKLRV